MTNASTSHQQNLSPLQQLRHLISDHFNLEDLRDLTFDLGIDFEDLPESGRQSKIIHLIRLMKQNRRLEVLLTAVSQTRPHLKWPKLTDVETDTLLDFRDTIDYHLTGTQTYYLPEISVGIENFLTNYLGTDENPIPFGGRDQQLEQLEQWRTHGKSQRLLLVAPSGRGKSALLTRWSQQLLENENVDIIFIPISARFNTNQAIDVFSFLTARLAYLYNKQPEKWGDFPASFWHERVADYLRESLKNSRQLLIIFDGLDEAAWDVAANFLPINIPSTIRVVVSARHLGGEEQSPIPWLRRLGWDRFPNMAETIELKKLTFAGVQDVLEKMGCPLDELGQNINVVSELHKLSEGDPLLVELYIKDLWQRGEAAARLKPEDLQNIQPGYKGYFERWWEDQKKLWGQVDPLEKALVNDILDLLAMAFGSLLIRDLRQLMPDNIRSRAIKRAIYPLNRFVIGDGKDQGFVFSHPKLGEYFCDDLDKDEQADVQARFLAWGEYTLANLRAQKVQSRDVSRYLMLYYGRHLEEANAIVEELLQLVSYEWMQVWHKKTGTYAGFLQDVDRVWGKIRLVNETAVRQMQKAPYIGQEILCALCHASVNSLADNIPDKLLLLLLQNKLWTEEQVIASIRRRKNILNQSKAFVLVSKYLSTKTRTNFVKELITNARNTLNEWGQVKVFVVIAPCLPQKIHSTILAEIIEIARNRRFSWDRAKTLAIVTPHLPQGQRTTILKEALAIAQGINVKWQRAVTLIDIIPYLAQEMPGINTVILTEIIPTILDIRDENIVAKSLIAIAPFHPEISFSTAQKIDNIGKRASVQAAVIPYLSPEKQAILLAEILSAVLEIRDEETQAEVLELIAQYRSQEVIAAGRRINDAENKASILASAIPFLPNEEGFAILEEALATTQQIDDKENQAALLITIPRYLPKPMDNAALKEALRVAQGIQDEWRRANIFASIAPYLPQETLAATQNIQDEGRRARVLEEIAPHLPQETLILGREIHDEWRRSRVLVAVIPHLSPAIRTVVLEETLTAARNMHDIGNQANTLEYVAFYLPQEVLIITREIHDEWRRTRVLAEILPRLPSDIRAVALEEALDVAQKLTDNWKKTRVLVAITPQLPQDMRKVVLKEALAATLNIYRMKERVKALSDIAPHLPQEALKATEEIDNEESRAQVLTAIAPYLPQEVLAATQKIRSDGIRASILTSVAPYIPYETLAVVQEIGAEWRQARTLITIATHLAQENMRTTVLEKALLATREIHSKKGRAKNFTQLNKYLLKFPQSQLYDLWQETLHTLSHRTRPNLLSDITSLMPVIHQLGSEKGVRDTWQAVQAVTKWWP